MNQPSAPLRVRPAAEADCADLWRWRNDETTRTMFADGAAVAWEAHAAWFAAALRDPLRCIVVGELDNAGKVGMCRFDLDADGHGAEISINLEPRLRGQGLSHRLLALAIAEFRAGHHAALRARIKHHNLASIRCFQHCGFVPAPPPPGADDGGYYAWFTRRP